MQCHDAKQLIHPMLDNELDTVTRKEVESHFSICEDCRRHFTELGFVESKLATVEWQKAPNGFTENVMGLLQQQHIQRHNWRVPFVRWTGIAAAALFVFSLGVWWSVPNHFSMTASPSNGLIVEGNKVIIPKGQELEGNLVIHNGDVVVEGKVKGDVITLNGQIYKQAGADISGKTEEINQTLQIFEYYLEKAWITVKETLQ